MPIPMLDAIEFSKIPSLQFAVPYLSANPTGYSGGIVYNYTTHRFNYWDAGASQWRQISNSADLTGYLPTSGGTITGNLTVNGQFEITNLLVDTIAGKTGAVVKFNNRIDMFYNQITNLPVTPSAAGDAVSKQYVDSLMGGNLTWKQAVRVVSTTNLAMFPSPASIDGVALVYGDRILLTAQTNPAENGMYTATDAGTAMYRATDSDSNGDLSDGVVVPVAEGTANGDSLWVCTATTAKPWIAESSGSTWTKMLTVSDQTAGAGLVKTGNQLDVVSANADMTVGANAITINSAPMWSTARTLTLGTDLTGNVSIKGDAAMTLNATVANNAITNAKLADMPTMTIKGNVTGGTADPVDLTATQGRTLLNVPSRYAVDIGNGSLTQIDVTHSLGTLDVITSVYTKVGGEVVMCKVTNISTTQVRLNFAVAPTSNQYRVVVIG